MANEKIEKKLPDEILAYIDDEAARHAINRQEAISRIINTIIADKNEHEIERLRNEIKGLSKLIAMKDDEISYLRTELGTMNRGLSKLAENMARTYSSTTEVHALIEPIRGENEKLAEEINSIRKEISQKSRPFEQHLPLIIIGVLAALLIIYLIVMKV